METTKKYNPTSRQLCTRRSLLKFHPSIIIIISIIVSSLSSLLLRRSSAFSLNTRIHHLNHWHLHTSQIRRTSLSMSTTSTLNKNPYKRSKLSRLPNSSKQIATHSGTFQADEALGVWLLRQTAAYRNSPVIRTRDPAIYNSADIVIDVGGTYSHELKRYDHHQRDYDERFPPKLVSASDPKDETTTTPVSTERCTKLSASGLVYRHYGKEVIFNLYPNLTQSHLDYAYEKMYDSFMEAVDAVDTGVEPVPPGTELVYKDNTGLSRRVSRLNPRWNEDNDDNDKNNTPDQRFEKASSMCGEYFEEALAQIVESDIPARSFVEIAVQERMDVDPSGEIIRFVSGGLPWRGHLYDLERELGLTDDQKCIKFVLYTDQAGMWRVQAVTVPGKAFENRLSLPQEWRGVRDEDLESISGIPGAKFCHAAGFIAGCKDYDGVLQMARVALKRK